MPGEVIMTNFVNRISERYETNAACTVCTVLETLPAAIVDISRHGAKVNVVNAFKKDDRISIDIEGETVWGEVTWAEHDRIGMKFLMPLQSGRFHRILVEAQAYHNRASGHAAVAPAKPTFGRRVA